MTNNVSRRETKMTEERISRDQEVRSAAPVHDEYANWDNDTLLGTENIPARVGYVQRWVRTSVKGTEDQSNVFKKFNKAWKPRALSTIPKGQYVMHIDFQGTDVVGIHGMILMERPVELHERESRSVTEQTQLQMSAVKQNMYKVHDPASGLSRPEFTEESSKASRGRIAPVDAD